MATSSPLLLLLFLLCLLLFLLLLLPCLRRLLYPRHPHPPPTPLPSPPPQPSPPPPPPPRCLIDTSPMPESHCCGCFNVRRVERQPEERQPEERDLVSKIKSFCSDCFGVPRVEWREEFQPGLLKKIIISYNNSIRSIQMVNQQTANGRDRTVIYPKHGGYGRHRKEIIFGSGEILTGISGRSSYWSKTLKSITFHTDKRKMGPYGGKEGHPFSYDFPNGTYGFYGICNNTRIMSIGVIVKQEGKKQEGARGGQGIGGAEQQGVGERQGVGGGQQGVGGEQRVGGAQQGVGGGEQE